MHINEPKIIRRISDDDKTTRVSDKWPFCFKMAEELIWIILRENNVELSQDTLNFHLKKVLEDHKDLYNSMSARIGRNNVLKNLVSIYQELEPSNFGRIMAYLTMVSKMSDYCDTETVRKAVEITVVDLKRFDLAKYAREKLPLSQRILSWLLH